MRPHEKLVLWQKSVKFVRSVYYLTNLLPESEKFGLTSQLKRASVSVPANIAEGAARKSSKEFLHFLHISSGSLSETDTLVAIARELDFIGESEHTNIRKESAEIASLLNGLIRKLKTSV